MNMMSMLLGILGLMILVIVVPILIRQIYYSKHPGELRTPHDYTIRDGKFFDDFKQVLWYRRILKQKLVVNMHYQLAEQVNNEAVESTDIIVPGQEPMFVRRAETTAKEEQQCTREEYWTNRPTKEIHNAGYLPVTGMPRVSGLLWAGVPVFMSVTGAYKFEITDERDPETGLYKYPHHTPALLENKIRSQATKKFLNKFRKANGPAMDGQAIIMMIVLVVGAIAGMWWLGIF